MREAAGPEKSRPSRAQRIASGWTTLRNLVLNVVGAAVFIVAAWLLWDAVTKPTIAIAPISVPEELQKKGYTSEVMAHKLRAAVSKLIKEAKSVKGGADIAGPSDIPDIVVPRTGLSVETIAAQIRKIFRRTNRWQVSGGVAAKGDLYEMNLKIANDVESQLDSAPIAEKEVEPLIDASARNIVGYADPLSLAVFDHMIGDENMSLGIARKIVEQSPKSEAAFWAHYLIGNIYFQNSHELDAALKEYGAALAFQPVDTLMHRATVFFYRWLFGAALDRNYAVPHFGLGYVLRVQGRPDEAIAEYKKAIELDPKYATPHNNLGNVLSDQGKPDAAIAEYKKAIELDSKAAFPHNGLGNVLRAQGKSDEAIAEYKKAIELDPKDAVPHFGLGYVLRVQGRPDEAIAEYKKAIELDPKMAGLHYNLGVLLGEQGKREGAIAEYKKAIELDPKYAFPHANLGHVLQDQGKLDAAMTEFKKAVELAPDNADFRAALDRALKPRREAQGQSGAPNPAAPKAKKK